MKTQICTVGDDGDGFRSFSTLKILKWTPVSLSYICVQISIFGAFSISLQIQYRENLAIIRYIGQIWDGRQKVKPLIVWDFPDI